MSTNNPSDPPEPTISISDIDLGQISAGNGSDPDLSIYDKKDLESLIARAEKGGHQELAARMALELKSRSPDEPYVKPIIWDD